MNVSLKIRRAEPSDVDSWSRLRHALWPDGSLESLRREAFEILAAAECATFLASIDGHTIGFVEVSLRSTAEGCHTTPVGFIEGWFVSAAHRGRGVGRELIAVATEWARSKGCTELGSDTELSNLDSQRAHRALGFHALPPSVNFFKTI